jgi:diacylglycerol kinase (ATP)
MNKNATNTSFSFKKRILSFRYAFSGILHLIKTQHNAWIHLFIAFLVILSGILFRVTRIEWMMIVVCIGMVITTEIINTTIEYFIDVISPGYNEKAGRVKDLAAAAVLVVSITAAIVGLIIFIPYFIVLIKQIL